MTFPPTPGNEVARLARLRDYGVLDTPAEAAFDRITRLASTMLGVPIALVSLVDADRQWFKSRVGLETTETPRRDAFCAHAILHDAVMVVEDAVQDERFADNPLVVGEPNIRFYAGAPLQTADGFRLGTLCAIDTVPRRLSNAQMEMLKDLAAIVMDEFELRIQAERARQAEQRLFDAVEALSDGFILYDADDRLVICNQRFKEIYAESADLICEGESFGRILRKSMERGQYPEATGREAEWFAKRMYAHLNPGAPIEQQLPGNRWMRIEERRTRDGGLVGFRVDITELKRQEQRLEAMAWTDVLTGALNRRRFFEIGRTEVRRIGRSRHVLSVLLIDIDHFKQVNDNFGHAAGDVVLEALVARWRPLLRQHDQIGRLGGEEFAILLPESDAETPAAVADRLRQAAEAAPFEAGEQSIEVTVSIGHAQLRGAAETLDELLARADAALYQAKRTGRNRCVAAAA